MHVKQDKNKQKWAAVSEHIKKRKILIKRALPSLRSATSLIPSHSDQCGVYVCVSAIDSQI